MERVTITYFDTAMVLIEIGPLRFLTDPVFDNAGSSFDYGPVHLEKTIGGRVSASELGRIDAVLLSHDQHGDNLDRAGRSFLNTVPLVITTPLAASRLDGVKAVGVEPWRQVLVQGPDSSSVHVTAVPAQHGPEGTQDATGPVTGFILEWTGQVGGPLYVSGDTVLFEGTKQIAQRYAPIGIAVLNLGRVELEAMKGAYLSLSAAEAISYSQDLRAKAIVPVHCEGWHHFTEDIATAQAAFTSSSIARRVHWLTPGIPASFAADSLRE